MGVGVDGVGVGMWVCVGGCVHGSVGVLCVGVGVGVQSNQYHMMGKEPKEKT